MKKSEIIFTVLLLPLDYLMLVAAGMFAYFLRVSPLISRLRPVLFNIELPLNLYFKLVLLAALIWLIFFALAGLYKIKKNISFGEEFFSILSAAALGLSVITVYLFIKGDLFNSRFIVVAAWLFSILFVGFGRILIRQIQSLLLKKYGLGSHRVIIVGNEKIGDKIKNIIKDDPLAGYKLIKYFSEINEEALTKIVSETTIDDIILTTLDFNKEKILKLIDFCEEERLAFKFVPNIFQTLTLNTEIETLISIPLVELKRTALDGWGKVVKRIMDIVGAIGAIILFSPLMILIALLIKMESSGPIVYRNERVGQKKIFALLKFRTMKLKYCIGKYYPQSKEAEIFEQELIKKQSQRKGPVPKVLSDPRRTPLGKLLEQTSLDELLQFFNVLKGDISLVGPRPHQPKEIARYLKHHRKVFNIKPGLSGPAQISGRSDIDFEDEVKLDLYYIENWSLKLDLKILCKTPFAILFKKHQN